MLQYKKLQNQKQTTGIAKLLAAAELYTTRTGVSRQIGQHSIVFRVLSAATPCQPGAPALSLQHGHYSLHESCQLGFRVK
jgi:hypothetical protein